MNELFAEEATEKMEEKKSNAVKTIESTDNFDLRRDYSRIGEDSDRTTTVFICHQ